MTPGDNDGDVEVDGNSQVYSVGTSGVKDVGFFTSVQILASSTYDPWLSAKLLNPKSCFPEILYISSNMNIYMDHTSILTAKVT